MTKILFVCTGNICRSPTAHTLMEKLVKEAGLSEEFYCDSAGMIGYHTGEMADPRMRKHAEKRGVHITTRARQFKNPQDFEGFDFIMAMDRGHQEELLSLTDNPLYRKKIHLMSDFGFGLKTPDVPDPYYGGPEGFEEVMDILENALGGFLDHLQKS